MTSASRNPADRDRSSSSARLRGPRRRVVVLPEPSPQQLGQVDRRPFGDEQLVIFEHLLDLLRAVHRAGLIWKCSHWISEMPLPGLPPASGPAATCRSRGSCGRGRPWHRPGPRWPACPGAVEIQAAFLDIGNDGLPGQHRAT